MAERKALGRGLSALLGTPDLETDQLIEIEIERILPNAHQPRKSFDEESLNELASSIRTHGVVQPIVVRPLPDGLFQLIAGERRWRAAQRASLDGQPQHGVHDVDDRPARHPPIPARQGIGTIIGEDKAVARQIDCRLQQIRKGELA